VTAVILLSGSLVLGASENKEVASAEPQGDAINTLEVDASNFHFQADAFDVPSGINEIKYVSKEGSHTLAFEEPELSYVNLSVPGGKDATKVDFVEGQQYVMYCTLPGHRAAGMEATVTAGAAGTTPEAGTATPTTTLVGGPTSTTAPKGQSEVDQSQQGGTSQTGN
jgi:plastocyanin